jgi:hypothetical protein
MPIERLYREDLERQLAAMQARTGLSPSSDAVNAFKIASACHDTLHVQVAYYEGALHVRFGVCGARVASVAVQAREDHPDAS